MFKALLYQLSRIADAQEAANVIAASSAERDAAWFAWNKEIAQGNANTQDVLQVAISNIVERVTQLEQQTATIEKPSRKKLSIVKEQANNAE